MLSDNEQQSVFDRAFEELIGREAGDLELMQPLLDGGGRILEKDDYTTTEPDKFRIDVISPGGNETAVIRPPAGIELSAKDRVDVARLLMRQRIVEQVGYYDRSSHVQAPADAEFRMADGELCVNGIRSAALLTYFLRKKAQLDQKIKTSGRKSPVDCVCKEQDGGAVIVGATIRVQPDFADTADGTVVANLRGIVHLLHKVSNDTDLRTLTIDDHRELFRKHAKSIPPLPSGQHSHVVGTIFYNWPADKSGPVIKPTVGYDCDTQTGEIRVSNEESACGTGSIGVASDHIRTDAKRMNTQVWQPSGSVYTLLLKSAGSRGVYVTLESSVKIVRSILANAGHVLDLARTSGVNS